jgi:hypothetical protein
MHVSAISLEKEECGYVLPYMGMLMEVAGIDFHWRESRPFLQEVEFQSGPSF